MQKVDLKKLIIRLHYFKTKNTMSTIPINVTESELFKKLESYDIPNMSIELLLNHAANGARLADVVIH